MFFRLNVNECVFAWNNKENFSKHSYIPIMEEFEWSILSVHEEEEGGERNH